MFSRIFVVSLFLAVYIYYSHQSLDIACYEMMDKVAYLIVTGENKQLLPFDKRMEFDLIKQHRHFCPWIMSIGKSGPGWQQTLSALDGYKELSNVHSTALIEVQ